MTFQKRSGIGFALLLCAALAACGNRAARVAVPTGDSPSGVVERGQSAAGFNYEKSSIWDVFGPNKADQSVQVNRYIWNASLDVLSFLPVQTVDPFTGLIVTGYGTPPGGGRAYKATVHITDPALDARSLRVALQTRNGPVSAATARAVEDAILSRARQLRVSDDKL